MRRCTDTKPELCRHYNPALSVCDMPMKERCGCSKITIKEVPMSDHELANEKKRYWKITTTIALMLSLASFLLVTGALWYKWNMS